jgi:hypothetical protein
MYADRERYLAVAKALMARLFRPERSGYAHFPWRQHAERDYRKTTFSCCLCGGQGVMTSETPLEHIREDTRTDPQRQPKATARLIGRPVRPSVAFRVREQPRR